MLNSVKEDLAYTYTSKEYHYTLYYFDQAGGLVQTVPPQGVNPLTNQQVTASLNGTIVQPSHTLLTRYQYNSLDQLINQSTPDRTSSSLIDL